MIFGGHILFSAESEGFEPPVQLPVPVSYTHLTLPTT